MDQSNGSDMKKLAEGISAIRGLTPASHAGDAFAYMVGRDRITFVTEAAELSPLAQWNVIPEEGEWPKRDAVPFVREAVVTNEMVSAGLEAWRDTDEGMPGTVPAIYRAMHAVSPVELVSEGERIAVKERDEARAQLATLRQLRDHDREVIAAKDARIVELEDGIVFGLGRSSDPLPAAFVDPAPEPVKPNPFRTFPTDPRRMGP